MREILDDLSETTLGLGSLTLVVCLLLVIAMAAITRDSESVKTGAVFAAAFAVICLLANISLPLAWIAVSVGVAALFGFFAQSRGRRFWPWFAAAFFLGWILAYLLMRFLGWLDSRGSKYGDSAALAPA